MRGLSAAAVTATLWIGTLAAAAGADTFSGDFRKRDVKCKVVDAIAFRQDAGEPPRTTIFVAFADFAIDRKAFEDAIEPWGALVQQADQAKGNGLLVELVPSQKCGLSGYLSNSEGRPTFFDLGKGFALTGKGPGDARTSGECSGRSKGAGDEPYEFRLAFDLPVTSIRKPTPLGPGGGEPGAALTALVAAIRAKDMKTIRLHLPADQIPQNVDANLFVEGLALNYPKEAAVTGGRQKGEQAHLTITGLDNEGKKITGDFALRKTGGSWRVEGQSLYFAE